LNTGKRKIGLMPNIMKTRMARPVSGNNILIIDALNLAFRYKHSGREDFAEDYVNVVKSLAKSYDAKHIIITSDLGSSKYRLKIYPEYKADRRAKVAEQTEEDKEAFELFFEDFNECLKVLEEEFVVLKYKGVEADDIAAFLTHRVFKDFTDDIWLISSDKDWDLLLEDNVHRFSYVTRKEYTLENWNEHYDFPHSYSLDIKVLQGGKDNVAGIAGVGPKRAIQLIEQFGTAFDIYGQLPLPGKYVYIKNTNEFGADILRNIELIDKITYCEDAIGIDNCKDITEKVASIC
jgi:5'-3' exonuclease